MIFKVGDYIKWFDYFNDGIIKEAGFGVIIKEEETNFYGKRFKVYRNNKKDFRWFFRDSLEIKKEITNE